MMVREVAFQEGGPLGYLEPGRDADRRRVRNISPHTSSGRSPKATTADGALRNGTFAKFSRPIRVSKRNEGLEVEAKGLHCGT